MGSKHRTLDDLVLHQIKDLFYAERHKAKMMGKMAKVAADEALKAALEARQAAAEHTLERLEACFDALGKKAHGVPCEAMDGIVSETKSLIDDFEHSPALDAGLMGAAVAMEHYAVARYASLSAWLRQGEHAGLVDQVSRLLQEAEAAVRAFGDLGAATARKAQAGSPAAADAPALTLKSAALMGLR